jgi:excisionase family DNA binding protein
MGEEELITIKEVSDYLKVAEKTIYRMASEGKIPAFKVGGSWRFRRHEVQEWLENQRNNKLAQ